MTAAKRLLSSAVIFTTLASFSDANEPRTPVAPTETEDAERDKVWDSPKMVDARLFMDEYFAVSAQATPEEAREFRAQLEAMSADELRAWLAKFLYERQGHAQLTAANDKTRQYKLAVAQAARRRRQDSNERFNRSVRQGAGLAQSRVEKSFARTSQHRRYNLSYGRRRIRFWFRL